MLIWRGLKPAAIVAAMLAVRSDWRRAERRGPAAQDRAGADGGDESKGGRAALVVNEGAAVKPEPPLR